ncbi:MAG: tRNA (adenosine(37)-N6)-threonylcarbamoyltransferase complex transferase subunit TsaD [Phycisphaerae bacterium]|nr:tRNA (adenosine(37)-N6)-threonylcarbamoyltransferase complex transferase subunit TsaD [Phycisphaerae bacterium]
MNILGIESSCDETAAAVVADGKIVRSNVVASQIDLHAKYGGVVPEIASRAHLEQIIPVVREAMATAGVTESDIDAVAVANRPGLIGSLLIGVTAAKAIAWSWGKPLVAVNHIHSHAYSAMIARPEAPEELLPAVAMVVSGGHTSLYFLPDTSRIELMGRCIDDAAGEAFDKVAAILKLGYPGGPIIDTLAREGNPKAFPKLPRTWLAAGSLDFSFSGIKTAVLYQVHGQDMLAPSKVDEMSRGAKADMAASFQAAVVDVLVGKTLMAVERAGVRRAFLGGGVACNSALRAAMTAAATERGIEVIFSPPAMCTDNAAMHAALGFYRFRAGQLADLDLPVVAG